jgi:hypothetical protein
MTIVLILNILFSIFVLVGVVGPLAWSIAAEHRGPVGARVGSHDHALIPGDRVPLDQLAPSQA